MDEMKIRSWIKYSIDITRFIPYLSLVSGYKQLIPDEISPSDKPTSINLLLHQ